MLLELATRAVDAEHDQTMLPCPTASEHGWSLAAVAALAPSGWLLLAAVSCLPGGAACRSQLLEGVDGGGAWSRPNEVIVKIYSTMAYLRVDYRYWLHVRRHKQHNSIVAQGRKENFGFIFGAKNNFLQKLRRIICENKKWISTLLLIHFFRITNMYCH